MEYRIAKGWKIFVAIFSVIFLVLGILLFGHAFFESAAGPRFLGIIFGLIFIPTSILAYLDSMRTRLVIDDYSLTMYRAFSSRTLLLTEITGYRKGEKNTLFLIPKSENLKALRLSNIDYWERKDAFMTWLTEKYPDADVLEREAETRQIMENENFGQTMEDREVYLKKAVQVAKVANIVAIALAIWALMYPRPYEYVMIVLLATPWAGIVITWYFKGLMRLNPRKGSPYPSVAWLIFVPAACLLLRAMLDFDLYDYRKVWLPVACLANILTVVVLAVCKEVIVEKDRLIAAIAIFSIAFIYSYGGIVMTNCYHDRSVSEELRVEVKGKRISTGKSTNYYLRLAPWGRFAGEEEVRVARLFYDSTQTGEQVNIHLKKGKWGIPWFWITN